MLNQKVKMTKTIKKSNHKMSIGASVEKKNKIIMTITPFGCGALNDPFYRMWMKLKNF